MEHLAWRSGRTMCGKDIRVFSSVEEEFIKGYNKAQGVGYCSKCAKFLITRGKLIKQEVTITDSMKELIEKLTKATKDLHDQYIIATKKYAKARFKKMSEIVKWTTLDWCKYFNLTPELANASYRLSKMPEMNGMRMSDAIKMIKYDPKLKLEGSEFWTFPSSFYNTREYKRMRNTSEEAQSVVKLGYKEFEKREVEHAERHYSGSIWKLANRITEKSINTSKMKIVHGNVRNNGIDTIITDGVNSVHAWTIIAEGPIKRPHYRYLVK